MAGSCDISALVSGVTPFVPETTANKTTDGTLAANSDTLYPSEKAVKTYADTKQGSLGFTPENVANKTTDGTLAANSDTLYPSEKAVKTYADTKQSSLGFTPENVANKTTDGTLAANSDTLYPSEKAVKTYSDTKAPIASPTFTGTVTVPASVNPTDAAQKADVSAISPVANPAVTEPGNTVGSTPDYFYICNKYATGNSFTSTQFQSANQLICFQFHLSQRIQITKFVFELTQANNGKKIGVGIYSADGTSLLAEGRFTSGAGTGVQGVAPQGGSVILSRGMYWWAAACDDTGVLAARFIIPDATYDNILNSQVVHKGTAVNAMVGGAMPASLGVVTGSTTSRILVGLLQS